MKGYLFNNTNKEFIGEKELQLDYLESKTQGRDIYMLPNNCTLVKPLEQQKDNVVVFIDNQWKYNPDFRGQIFYDKQTKESVLITEIGEIKENLTNNPPFKYSVFDNETQEWVFDVTKLENVKSDKIKELNELVSKTIETKYPITKQINIVRGAKKYTKAHLDEMNLYIDNILEQASNLEETIKSKIKLNTLQAIEIKIVVEE